MGKTIGVVAVKGGVGKTTVSAAIASSLANHFAKKVLLIDANYSAPNLGLHMDIVEPKKTIHEVLDRKANINSSIHNKFGVDVIPGSYDYNKLINPLKLKDKIKTLKDKYDFVIVDSSPSLGSEILSTVLASDSLLLVTTPDYPTLSCSLKTAKLAKQRGKTIAGIILNKVRDPNYELSLKEIEQATDIPIVARIPDDKSASRAAYTRIPATVFDRKCNFSKEIEKLCCALTNTPEKKSILRKLLKVNFKREEINRNLLKENFYTSIFSKK